MELNLKKKRNFAQRKLMGKGQLWLTQKMHIHFHTLLFHIVSFGTCASFNAFHRLIKVFIGGTDDDFPPPHQNRMSRGGRNGRPANFGSVPYPRVYEETDMEAKIHQLEQEAYISILRAFKAQADAITWEGLITELRRELRLSNEEHRDLLSRVNADETIRRIRKIMGIKISEWRQSGGLQPAMRGASQAVHDPIPSAFHPQVMATGNQPSSSVAKHGHTMGAKGKKHKSVPAGASSMKMQYPSGPAGRGKFAIW